METNVTNSKLTPFGFKIAANTHLHNTDLLEALTQINLSTDESGNISQHTIKNIKTMLSVTIKQIDKTDPESTVKRKVVKMQEFMEGYE